MHCLEVPSPQTTALVMIGGVLLILVGIQEAYTKKKPAIIRARLFKTCTTSIILIVIFFHALAFFTGAYYLPLYFQALGSRATGAGITIR